MITLTHSLHPQLLADRDQGPGVMVAASVHSMFNKQSTDEVEKRWDAKFIPPLLLSTGSPARPRQRPWYGLRELVGVPPCLPSALESSRGMIATEEANQKIKFPPLHRHAQQRCNDRRWVA
jgi:hypothetical protein